MHLSAFWEDKIRSNINGIPRLLRNLYIQYLVPNCLPNTSNPHLQTFALRSIFFISASQLGLSPVRGLFLVENFLWIHITYICNTNPATLIHLTSSPNNTWQCAHNMKFHIMKLSLPCCTPTTATFLRYDDDDDDEISKTYKIPIPAISYVLRFSFWHTRREDKTF